MVKESRKKVLVHYILLSFSILLGILLDQWSKYLAVVHFKEKSAGTHVLIPKVLQLTYVENRGAAWGVLQGKQTLFFLIGILVLVLVFVIYRKIPYQRHYIPMRILAALLVMGAIGNMIDRIRQGYVVDFFEFTFISFPVFNVADIYVTVGSLLLIVFGLFFYKDEDLEFMKKADKNRADQSE
ncbi:MAG: signal peptidase II [Lachnospiraceae bacterium]|nr:signal peptidase II [Lachnospiraceae bacterium]